PFVTHHYTPFPTRRSSDLGPLFCWTGAIRPIGALGYHSFHLSLATLFQEDMRIGERLGAADDTRLDAIHQPIELPSSSGQLKGADRKSTRLNSSHQIISYA